MNLSIGILGLPNVGKSTLFNALLQRQQALVASYPFTTIEPNIGVVDVFDKRLDELSEIATKEFSKDMTEKKVPTVVKFVDIAGLVKGAHKGEGLGNQFLSYIREVDALVHLVRVFESEEVSREAPLDPKSDIQIVNTELILADLQTLDKKISEEQKKARSQDKEGFKKLKVYEKVAKVLNEGQPANTTGLSADELDLLRDTNLLTVKPVLYVYNILENDLGKGNAVCEGTDCIQICAKLESDLSQLEPKDREDYIRELGLHVLGLDKLIERCYELLNLVTFFTYNAKEVHSWAIKKGTLAPQAAGKIHTDFERGFISAEVIAFEDLKRVGTRRIAKEKGLLRTEGKNYTVKDGDVIEFRFSV